MQRLRAAQDGRERLQRRAHDVVERLLRDERHAGRLGVGAQHLRARVLRPEAIAHDVRPHAARRAQLGDLLEEVAVHVPEERQALREGVDVESGRAPELDVGDAVGQREGQLLHGRRARLADVVAAHADGVPARHAPRAVDQHVAHDAQVRAHPADPLLLRDELLEHVVLQRAAKRLGRDAAPLGHDDVERQQRDRGRVDRHRRRHLIEGDAVEQPLHVGDRGHRHALAPDLAARLGVVGVEAHERRHVEGRRQAGLPLFEQKMKAPVGVLGRAETREHAHRPWLAAVHARVRAAREREGARIAQIVTIGRRPSVGIGRSIERLELDPRLGLPKGQRQLVIISDGGLSR